MVAAWQGAIRLRRLPPQSSPNLNYNKTPRRTREKMAPLPYLIQA